MTPVRGDARQRASDKIARLAGQSLDLVRFWRASTEALASVVPHHGAPCWFTLDPASLLVTSHFDEGVPELPPQWQVLVPNLARTLETWLRTVLRLSTKWPAM